MDMDKIREGDAERRRLDAVLAHIGTAGSMPTTIGGLREAIAEIQSLHQQLERAGKVVEAARAFTNHDSPAHRKTLSDSLADYDAGRG